MLTPEQLGRFRQDGFLIIDHFLDAGLVEAARARFEPLFRGEFETGLYPDEWNWKEGRDAPDLTRQICNGWRSDRTVARIVLAEAVGRACAELMGWTGARLAQDNVIWKPPTAKPLDGYTIITRADGSTQRVPLTLRIDTGIEVDYLKHGGILPYVLRELLAAA